MALEKAAAAVVVVVVFVIVVIATGITLFAEYNWHDNTEKKTHAHSPQLNKIHIIRSLTETAARRNKNVIPKTACTIKQNYGINKTILCKFQCTNLFETLCGKTRSSTARINNENGCFGRRRELWSLLFSMNNGARDNTPFSPQNTQCEWNEESYRKMETVRWNPSVV